MSVKSVEQQCIRRYAAQQEVLVFGVAAQQVNWEFEVPEPTKMLAFGIENLVTNAINLALTALWVTNIRILINQTNVVVDGLNLAEYNQVVQVLETKEVPIINNGDMFLKVFNPPLPSKTRIQIQIVVNTLAASFPGGVIGAGGNMNAYTIDAESEPAARRLTHYRRIPNFPAPAVIVANQVYPYNLGNFTRKEKAIILVSNVAAVPSDIIMSRMELLADGKEVIRIPFPLGKMMYNIACDAAIAPPAGYVLLKAPGDGFQPAQNAQLTIEAVAHTAAAAGDFTGFEIYEIPF